MEYPGRVRLKSLSIPLISLSAIASGLVALTYSTKPLLIAARRPFTLKVTIVTGEDKDEDEEEDEDEAEDEDNGNHEMAFSSIAGGDGGGGGIGSIASAPVPLPCCPYVAFNGIDTPILFLLTGEVATSVFSASLLEDTAFRFFDCGDTEADEDAEDVAAAEKSEGKEERDSAINAEIFSPLQALEMSSFSCLVRSSQPPIVSGGTARAAASTACVLKASPATHPT